MPVGFAPLSSYFFFFNILGQKSELYELAKRSFVQVFDAPEGGSLISSGILIVYLKIHLLIRKGILIVFLKHYSLFRTGILLFYLKLYFLFRKGNLIYF